MKNFIKVMTLLSLSTLFVACEQPKSSDSIEDESSSNSEISQDSTIYTNFIELDEVQIEVDEHYSLKHILKDFKDIEITSKDPSVATYNAENSQIVGGAIGDTDLILSYQDQKQKVHVHVAQKGTYSSSFSFDLFHLEGKKIVSFGDSVTADATLHGTGKTYVSLFAENFNMELKKNYAIGGTTATYMYIGSNIYKEYATNTTAIDGCRVVNNAYTKGELNDVDYAFIAYGHNDQYFQPPISAEGDSEYQTDSFKTCISYKGSYRFMINTLRKANPNVRVILLNCTYSEYDKTNPSPYGKQYTYDDYREATKEIADEMNCRYVDPWRYLKDYCDYTSNKYYYQDPVHLSANGHKLLSEFIFKN